MTTPEDRDRGASADQQADRAAWGGPPAGGWGEPADPARAWDRPAADDEATRADAPRGAHPGGVHPGGDVAPADATRLEHPAPGGAPDTRQWAGPDPQAPAWAQQPGPGGGWNQQQGPYPTQQLPPHQGSAQQPSPWGPPQPGGYPQGAYPPGPPQGGQWGGPGGAPGGPPAWGGQQQQPWGGPGGPAGGPGYPPLPGPTGPRRRSRLPLVLAGVAVLALAVFLVLGFVAPGFLRTTVFDQAALQSGVQRVLTDDYRYAGVGEVRCGTAGEVLEVRTGAQFTCSATIDGAPATIPVRVTSDTGDYEVSRPL